MYLCVALFLAATTRKIPCTVRAAIALPSSCMWVTNQAKYCIFVAARVLVTIRMASC